MEQKIQNQLKVSDLRVGNIIHFGDDDWEHFNKDSFVKNRDFKITGFNGSEIVHFEEETIISGMKCISGCRIEHCEPIPLTEEWILKLGFISNPYFDRYELNRIHIECDKTQGNLVLWIQKLPKLVKLEYVHQLQNLYYALTGEELTYGK